MKAIVGTAEFRGRLFVSERIHGEVLSALNHAFRDGRLAKKAFRAARREFYSHYPDIFAVVEDQEAIRDGAIQILNRYFRRAITHPDATHLAAHQYIAQNLPDPNIVFVTSDGPVKEVATRLLIPVFDPEVDDLRELQ